MTEPTVIQGKGIEVFMTLALLASCKLEMRGLKHSSGRSALAEAKRRLKLKRNTKPEVVIDLLRQHIETMKEQA
jgi:hypothetical protein